MGRNIEDISEEEMKELVELYDDGALVKDIIEQFDLDIHVSQLSKHLPPIPIVEECIYCGVPLVKRRSRTPSSYSFEYPYCPECGHIEYSISGNPYKKCDCDNCKKAELEKEKSLREIILNTWGLPKFRDESELAISEMAKLYILFLCFGYDTYDSTFLYSNDFRIDFDVEDIASIIDELSEHHIIDIDPKKTRTDNFNIVDGNVESCKIFNSWYKVCVNFTDETNKRLRNEDYSLVHYSEKEQRVLLKMFMLIALRKNLNTLMRERGFYEPNFNVIKFGELLELTCYSSIVHFEYKQANFCLEMKTTKHWTDDSIEKSISTFVYNSYFRVIERGWEPYKSKLDYTDELLFIVVTVFLERNINVLNFKLSEIFPDVVEVADDE